MKAIYSDFCEEGVSTLTIDDTYEYEIEEHRLYSNHHVKILKENNGLNKAIGNYISIEVKNRHYYLYKEQIKQAIIKQIKKLTLNMKKTITKVMVVGLGNELMSCDAFGSMVLSKIHKDQLSIQCSLIKPGVKGNSEINTFDHIEALKKVFKPDLIIIIDALATSKLTRLYQVIQINDVGIIPGGGVGNIQKMLNKTNLGVDVLCIGVASVIAIESILEEMIYDYNEVKNEEFLYTMVSFKSLDYQLNWMSDIVASAINDYLDDLV